MAKKKETVAKVESKAQKSVIISPRITEKAAIKSESKGVYTFNVERDATKKSIAAVVKSQYKVTPLKIAIVNMKGKTVVFRGRLGKRVGSKKAYVYLKKGDKIEFA